MILIELAHKIGLDPKLVASTQGGEYHSPCPSCGGTDRLVIQPNKQMKNCLGYYFCRQCGIYGDSIQFCLDHLGFTDFKEAVNYVGGDISFKVPNIFAKKENKPLIIINKLTEPWSEQASMLVEEAHTCLLSLKDILETLYKRGLPLDAIKQYKIGWLDKDKKIEGHLWGLEKETIWFTAGILIPTIEQDQTVIRLKIRRKDWWQGDRFPKYVAISGNMNGLNIIGNKKNSIMIIVESELDAYALHYALSDIAVIVAVGGCIKNPDSVTDYLAKHKSLLLICHDNDDAGKTMLDKWKGFYSNAEGCPTPIGKDIGEAIQQGLDLRSWIITKLPTQMQYTLNLIKRPWTQEDQTLIDWFLNEKKLPLTPFVLSTKEHGNEDVSDPVLYYNDLRLAIAEGHDGWPAKNGKLQEILRLLKVLVEQNNLNV